MSTVIVDTTDLGRAEQLLSAHYSTLSFVAQTGPTRTRAVRSTVGSLVLDDISYTYDFDYVGEPLDHLCLTHVRSGALEHRESGDASVVSGPGTATAISWREGVPYAGHLRHGHFDTVLVDRGLLGTVAAAAPGHDESARVTLRAGTPVSSAANNLLVRTIRYIVRDVLSDPAAAASPLVRNSVTHHLVSCVLHAFPSTAVFEPTVEDRRDATPLLLRRAIAFIDDNAHRPVTVADVAAAVHVTPRALQLMFRRHRDCTPREYLRRVRLDHAHRDLQDAVPAGTTVAAVAARWGFAHPGKFAAHYRATYGVAPHATLAST
ncbi:helix-turn-helix domain-containing protein [Rhodococcoides kroppenstedtii]|uniref:helix-turn-helix domain-containing protein n=1 Tax=Rhodococcoides kroppenstedtii TaxID=293050 RepID=UPI001427DA3D|nr:helix-turn-helix domain-containing protein [Rhodococcus kroppenstedtii]NIL80401.1 hypothetical protein [Rhodococcus kroppenstedtii]